MSTDPTFERTSILLRAQEYLLGGRVYSSIPDDQRLERGPTGRVRPYAVVHYGTVYRLGTSRSLVGEEEQPHVLPITIQCYAPNIEAAQASAGAVRDLFVGWQASPGSDEITSPGGTAYRDRDSAGTPTLYIEAVSLECVFNLGSNDGAVPTPGGAPGFETIDTIETLAAAAVAKALAEQQVTQIRYDFPVPVGSWPIHHALGHVPSVRTYDLMGVRLFTDEESDEQNTLLTWANPTAGFAILT
jgi:hypothetical protein